jgi:hypothetical protein
VRIAYGRHDHRPGCCRLNDPPGRAAQAGSSQPAQHGLDAGAGRQRKNPVLSGEHGGPTAVVSPEGVPLDMGEPCEPVVWVFAASRFLLMTPGGEEP